MNHQHKVAQNSNANFHHHETCITLCDDARNKNLKLRHLASTIHFVMFVFVICSFSYCCIHVCSCSTFSCCSICCSFVFILSFCIFGLLVVVHSSSHHHLHVCNFYTISYMHSILQIFVQIFATTFNARTFASFSCVFFSLYLIVTFVKTTIVYQCDGHRR